MDDTDRLHEYLKVHAFGKGRTKPATVIAEALHVSERRVGSLVAELIHRKLAVCSTCAGGRDSGYFIPRSREEAKESRRNLVNRRDALTERIKDFDEALERAFGAPTLFDLDEVGGIAADLAIYALVGLVIFILLIVAIGDKARFFASLGGM